MMVKFITALVVAYGATALHENNLAYLSPSRRHPGLAIPQNHIAKRDSDTLYNPDEVEFTHGIASGDPLEDSVILWTRLSPSSNNTASDTVPEGVVPIYDHPEADKPSGKSACVEFKISTDERFTDIVDQGKAYTSSDVDFTVKVSKPLPSLHLEARHIIRIPIVRGCGVEALHYIPLPIQCVQLGKD